MTDSASRYDWLNRPSPVTVELAYMAGIFDGEGCININIAGGKYPKHSLQISVSNLSRTMLDLFSRYYPVDIRPNKLKSGRPYWTWKIVGNKAKTFLIDVFRFLIIKKEQASVAIEFQEKRKSFLIAHGPKGQRRITEEEMVFRNTMKNRINALNQGVAYARGQD